MMVVFKYISTYLRGTKKNTKFRGHLYIRGQQSLYLLPFIVGFFPKRSMFQNI